MAEIRVADISRWQGIINWDEFKNHVQGVVIKAGGADGGLYTDNLFTRNRDEARRTGVPRWFYWYKGGAGSARQQAEYFLSAIGGLKPGEGVVLDDENESQVNVGFDAEFADRIKELTGGLNIVLYSNQARFRGDLQAIKDRNIGAWSAKYGTNSGNPEGSAATAGILPVIMWQYTSQARIPGVSANTVDMNIFYGDQSQFQKYGAPGAIPAPSTPAPTPAPAATGDGYYTVVQGDGLIKIGEKLGLDWKVIAATNGIVAPYTIFPGQRLKVFGGAPAQPQAGGGMYLIVPGDNLIGIGAKTGHSWQDIAKLNGIAGPAYTIYAGKWLKLPGGGVAPAAQTQATYTVVSGDGLIKIGQKTGKDWQAIARLNGIAAPYTIYPNQVLKLP